eukprot:jgi/Mesvir1/19505/Mv26274-RA.1
MVSVLSRSDFREWWERANHPDVRGLRGGDLGRYQQVYLEVPEELFREWSRGTHPDGGLRGGDLGHYQQVYHDRMPERSLDRRFVLGCIAVGLPGAQQKLKEKLRIVSPTVSAQMSQAYTRYFDERPLERLPLLNVVLKPQKLRGCSHLPNAEVQLSFPRIQPADAPPPTVYVPPVQLHSLGLSWPLCGNKTAILAADFEEENAREVRRLRHPAARLSCSTRFRKLGVHADVGIRMFQRKDPFCFVLGLGLSLCSLVLGAIGVLWRISKYLRVMRMGMPRSTILISLENNYTKVTNGVCIMPQPYRHYRGI